MTDSTATKNRAELASEQGFTGTFDGFIAWLTDAIGDHSVQVTEQEPDRWGRVKVRLHTVTHGISSHELLLGRLKNHWRMAHHWVSSSRGGATVYEFSIAETKSRIDHVWLEPDTGLFERLMRARRIRLYAEDGTYTEAVYEHGAEFLFQEPDRDVMEPNGLVIVRPAPPLEELYR